MSPFLGTLGAASARAFGRALQSLIRAPFLSYSGQVSASDFTLDSSSYEVIGNLGSHYSTDWQISSDIDFNSVIIESLDDTTNKVSWTPTSNQFLPLSQNLYSRSRYRTLDPSSKYSNWSSTLQITTPSTVQPVLTSATLSDVGISTYRFTNEQLKVSYTEKGTAVPSPSRELILNVTGNLNVTPTTGIITGTSSIGLKYSAPGGFSYLPPAWNTAPSYRLIYPHSAGLFNPKSIDGIYTNTQGFSANTAGIGFANSFQNVTKLEFLCHSTAAPFYITVNASDAGIKTYTNPIGQDPLSYSNAQWVEYTNPPSTISSFAFQHGGSNQQGTSIYRIRVNDQEVYDLSQNIYVSSPSGKEVGFTSSVESKVNSGFILSNSGSGITTITNYTNYTPYFTGVIYGSVTYGNGYYARCKWLNEGVYSGTNYQKTTIQYSTDGFYWTNVYDSNIYGDVYSGIGYFNGYFYAFNTRNGKVAKTNDFVNWTIITTTYSLYTPEQGVKVVILSNYIVFGTFRSEGFRRSQMIYSSDGTNFSKRDVSDVTYYFDDPGNGYLYNLGLGGGWRTNDFSTFTSITGIGEEYIGSVGGTDSRMWLRASNTYTSTNGTSFSVSSPTPGAGTAFLYNGSKYFYRTDAGITYESSNGTTWTQILNFAATFGKLNSTNSYLYYSDSSVPNLWFVNSSISSSAVVVSASTVTGNILVSRTESSSGISTGDYLYGEKIVINGVTTGIGIGTTGNVTGLLDNENTKQTISGIGTEITITFPSTFSNGRDPDSELPATIFVSGSLTLQNEVGVSTIGIANTLSI